MSKRIFVTFFIMISLVITGSNLSYATRIHPNHNHCKTISHHKKQLFIKARTEDVGSKCQVNYYLYAVDQNGVTVWEKVWKNLALTELDVASDYNIVNDTIYIEVYGELFAIDLYTGCTKWGNVRVGASNTPLVDTDGTIYCTGFYGPDITAVDPSGKIKWHHESLDADMHWPHELVLKNNHIYLSYDHYPESSGLNCCVLDKQGNLIKKVLFDPKASNWDKVTASSSLEPKTKKYTPYNIVDHNAKTAWVEGKNNHGIDEWIKLESTTPKEIHQIHIRNGYGKSEKLYYANSRIKKIKLDFSDGTSIIKDIKDNGPYSSTSIPLGKTIHTNFVKFTILDVYKGSKYSDTCISGITTY